MSKKWITKNEIKELLETYSVRKNEFIETSEYMYKSRLIDGYVITIQQETDMLDGTLTGGIILRHTNQAGYTTYVDVWMRDKNNTLVWKYRNPANMPFSDREVIKNLEEQVDLLKQQLKLSDIPKKRGRKPQPEIVFQKQKDVAELLSLGKTETEIMNELGMSRATYYRYKRRLKEL